MAFPDKEYVSELELKDLYAWDLTDILMNNSTIINTFV